MRRETACEEDLCAQDLLGDLELARLFFNFLRISPSYALVSSSPGIKVTRKTPERSAQVIRTFKAYGDVHIQSFDAWMKSCPRLSGKTTLESKTLIISKQERQPRPENHLSIFVPLGLKPVEATRQFREMVVPQLNTGPHQCRHNIRRKTLWKALATVYQRAKHPSLELWRIGLLANLVDRYQGKINPWEQKKLAKQAEMRRHLTLMVVRALVLALVVSENSAIGAFPVKTPISGEQLEFPFAEHRLFRLLSESGDTEFNWILKKLH